MLRSDAEHKNSSATNSCIWDEQLQQEKERKKLMFSIMHQVAPRENTEDNTVLLQSFNRSQTMHVCPPASLIVLSGGSDAIQIPRSVWREGQYNMLTEVLHK